MIAAKIRTVVRIRPMLEAERHDTCVVEAMTDGRSVQVNETTEFAVDAIYNQHTTQSSLYVAELPQCIAGVEQGYNATVFCYGTSGTGKTYTMLSADGIVPRALADLLATRDRLNKMTTTTTTTTKGTHAHAVVTASFVEVYNDTVFDLLQPAAVTLATRPGQQHQQQRRATKSLVELKLRKAHDNQLVMSGMRHVTVGSADDFYTDVYTYGVRNRSTGGTRVNKQSSRSHTLLSLQLTHWTTANRKVTGRLHLVDLAGNEDNRRSGNTGQRLAESSKINTSLMVLGKVIEALRRGDSRVPYRDSKLTRILQDSLGGRNRAVIICTIAPCRQSLQLTMRTLEFAASSRQITNHVHANTVTTTTAAAAVAVAAKRKGSGGETRAERLREWRQSKKPRRSESVHDDDDNDDDDDSGGDDDDSGRRPSKKKATTTTKTSARPTKKKRTHGQSQGRHDDDDDGGEELMDLTLLTPHVRRNAASVLREEPQLLEKLERVAREVTSLTAEIRHKHHQHQHQHQHQHHAHVPAVPAALPPPTQSASSSMVPMTPVSSAHAAKGLVAKAKQHAHDGDGDAALRCYQHAAALLPNNEKLSKKIQKLRKQQQQPQPPPPSSPSPSSSSRPPVFPTLRDVTNNGAPSPLTGMVMGIVNNGDMKQIQALHCIGKKRAQLIIDQRPYASMDDFQSRLALGDKIIAEFRRKNHC